jgi:hypothetical protein
MPAPDNEIWRTPISQYYKLWNVLNCFGLNKQNHVQIKVFHNTGSQSYNYKGYFSVMLMMAAVADGMFITTDISDYRRTMIQSSKAVNWSTDQP